MRVTVTIYLKAAVPQPKRGSSGNCVAPARVAPNQPLLVRRSERGSGVVSGETFSTWFAVVRKRLPTPSTRPAGLTQRLEIAVGETSPHKRKRAPLVLVLEVGVFEEEGEEEDD